MSQTPYLDPPPNEPAMPAGSVDRAEHTRLRRRILYGQWREDLRARVRTELQSTERAEAWGEPDLTGNIFTPACATLAALYAPDRPTLTAPAGGEAVLGAAESGGLWDLMVRVQRDCIGLREMLIRVEAAPDGTIVYTPVYPDRVVARAGLGARDVPTYVSEARYEQPEGAERSSWYWHQYDVTDESRPTYRIVADADQRSAIYEQSGDAYPVWLDGRPLLPYSLYHAERTGQLFDPWEAIEVVEGSLRLGVLWTFFGHLVRNASWPQRYMIGAFVAGTGIEDGGSPARIRVTADPARVLTLVTEPDTAVSPQIGSWGVGADPESMAGAIERYERRIIGLAGLDSATVARKEGDARSGYALAVSQEFRKELRRRYEPQFRRGDLETLRVTAAVLGSAAGVALPGTGYTINYGTEPIQPMGVEDGAAG